MTLNWWLEGFDPETDLLVHSIALPRLNSDDVRRILNVYDNLPIEPFSYNIPNAEIMNTLLGYADSRSELDDKLEYFLACRTG